MTTPAQLEGAPLISDWIEFLPDQTARIKTGRVELGQGNLTALLQIAADELGLNLDQVHIVGGDTRCTPNEGFTSGSLSIAQGGMAMRWAASAARALILNAAADSLHEPSENLALQGGRILCHGRATTLALWPLASQLDLRQTVLSLAKPKAPEQRSLAGLSVPRIDLQERLLGTPFVHDMDLPDMVHGRMLQAPCYGARLAALDEGALRAREGILCVWRDGDLLGIVAEKARQLESAHSWALKHATWALPVAPIDNPRAYMADAAEPISTVHEKSEAAGQPAHQLTHRVSRPYISHGSIGPSAAVARWSGQELEVWSHAQGPYPLQEALATVMAIGIDQVCVRHRPGAGCYGHNGADDVALDAALLARAIPGRAVKVVWSRADEFQCAPAGPAMCTEIKASLDQTHRLLGMEITVNSAPHGNRPGRNGSPNLRGAAFLAHPMPPSKSSDIALSTGGGADRNAVPLYDMPQVKVHKRLIHRLPYRTSSMRALGAHVNVYALETLMDRLAAMAQQDVFDYRLRHLSDTRARAVLEALRDKIAPLKGSAEGEGAGWGIGFAKYKNTAAYCAVAVRAEVQHAVRISHAFAVLDGGEIINPDGVINQTEGGMLQAMSWTLMESLNLQGPCIATESWLDYPILKFSDVPQLDVHLINRPELPPLGCAEAAQGPMAAAIGNAVFQAIGVHVKDLPINHEALVQAALET